MIVVVMGVSGSGKTTVGQLLARELGWTFIEGDDFHPQENIAKMAAGIPLTEEDRLPWIDALRSEINRLNEVGQNGVLASSALTKRLRDRLSSGQVASMIVYLRGDPQLIRSRLKRRTGHFFSSDLLTSQFEALEEPQNALVIDIARPPEVIVAEILAALDRSS